MESNIYRPPSSATQEARSPQRLVRKYLAATALLAIVAVVLSEVSLGAVRLLLPDYPRLITLGTYMPIPPVHFFHSVGASGLAVVFFCRMRGDDTHPLDPGARSAPESGRRGAPGFPGISDSSVPVLLLACVAGPGRDAVAGPGSCSRRFTHGLRDVALRSRSWARCTRAAAPLQPSSTT